jgi:hypothetical protein
MHTQWSIKSQGDPCKVCTGTTLSQVLKNSQGRRAQGVRRGIFQKKKKKNLQVLGKHKVCIEGLNHFE